MKVRRRRGGRGVVVRLLSVEVELLQTLPPQLDALYDEPRGADLASDRLFPPAYFDPEDQLAEDAWRARVVPDLVAQRREALEMLVSGLDRAEGATEATVSLAPDEVDAWLAVLNDARLALGVRLDVTADRTGDDVADDDPLAPTWMAYRWLTAFQDLLVDARLEDFS